MEINVTQNELFQSSEQFESSKRMEKSCMTNRDEVKEFSLCCSCAARQVSLVSPNLLLPWGSGPVSASGLPSAVVARDVEMLYCSFCLPFVIVSIY